MKNYLPLGATSFSCIRDWESTCGLCQVTETLKL